MSFKTYEDILVESLPADNKSLGTGVARTTYLAALAERAADLVDLDRGRLHPDWGKLDDPRYRSRIVTWNAAT